MQRSDDGDFPWGEWLDGRPRRLKRGKHFTGDPKQVQRRAEEAAAELGKMAVTSKDGSGTYEYLWIQFVDGEVALGAPCPLCGSAEFVKAQKFFVRCRGCGATLESADDQQVLPGTYAPPAPDAPEGGVAEGESLEEAAVEKLAAVRSSPLGEILGTRILSRSHEEIEALSAEEEVYVETTIVTFEPGLRSLVTCSIHADRLKVLSSQSEDWQEMPTPGRYAFTARLPARLFSERLYTVKVFVDLVDLTAQTTAGLLDRDAASFTVTLDLLEQLLEPGVVHPEVAWSFRAETEAGPLPPGLHL